MNCSRREALVLGGGLSTSVLSGCTGLLPKRPRLTLTLLNFDSDPHWLHLELLREDADEYSNGLVLRERYELSTPPDGESAYAHREPDVRESRKYIVEAYLLEAPSTRRTYHFYPDCTGNDEPSEELYIQVNTEGDTSEPYIGFNRNMCGSRSWWY